MFSLLDLDKVLRCNGCGGSYTFDESLCLDIRRFVSLCCCIQEARSILGQASISMQVGCESVEVPFDMLLTRFPASLRLKLSDGRSLVFRFVVDATELAYKNIS